MSTENKPPIYKSLVKERPFTILTIAYIVALAVIGGMSLGAHMVVKQVIVEQESTARIVNIAGRQRMLSQRTALFLARMVEGKDASVTQKLQQTIDKFEVSHNALINGDKDIGIPDELSRSLKIVYFDDPYLLDERVNNFISDIKTIIDTPIADLSDDMPEYKRSYVAAQNDLLFTLDTAVKAYEMDATFRIERLVNTQTVVLIIIFSVLLFEAFVIFRPLVNRVRQYAGKLEKMAMSDELTGAMNRRAYFKRLRQEINRSKRYKSPLTVAVFDLDKFKSINDVYGHNVGDLALKSFSEIASKNIRSEDVFARIGGEEFAILFPETNIDAAAHVAEKIRSKLEGNELILPKGYDEKFIKFTTSIGLAQYDSERDHEIDDLGIRADNALYEAKNEGRNQIVKST